MKKPTSSSKPRLTLAATVVRTLDADELERSLGAAAITTVITVSGRVSCLTTIAC